MAKNFFAELTVHLAAPIRAAVSAAGATDEVALTPPTREGTGDLALACHRFARTFKKAPQAIAEELIPQVLSQPKVKSVEAVAGFLNLRLDWSAIAPELLDWALEDEGAIGQSDKLSGEKVVIEYSSPNTNKPQHLGHCRNNILGVTLARIMKAAGATVQRVNLVNDRGIHICKSMVAYRRFGDGVTPESSGKKSDHLVGDFYVLFDQKFNAEYAEWCDSSGETLDKDAYFNSGRSALGEEARNMLIDWENGDDDVRELWAQMNEWCESGFAQTYARLGVAFDKIDHESETYLLGKDIVAEGLAAGQFHKAENGAVVFDLSRIGLEGEKALLRANGTSVYTTQDLGTALKRYTEYNFDRMIYVVGNEQDHHFRVLFGILEHIRPELAGRLHHLSYGMVELPDGKMKSREGTVVDADDLMDELQASALSAGIERWPHLDEQELDARAEAIALGGLKFFLLKYAPATTFIFDRERSISLEGETGAYCQYAYARSTSVLAKLGQADEGIDPDYSAFEHPQAIDVLRALLAFPGQVQLAAQDGKPSLVTKATFDIAKSFAAFYNHKECRVIGVEPGLMAARARLVRAVRRVLGGAFELLGILPLDEM